MLQIFANETPSKKLRDMGGCDPRCDISHRVLAHPEREERMDSRNILVTGPAINEQAVKLIADNGYGVTMSLPIRTRRTWSGSSPRSTRSGSWSDGTLRGFRH